MSKVEMNTRLDWRETTRAYELEVSPPGFTDDYVLAELQGSRVLQVSVANGKFVSRFKVPDDARLERLKASTHDGVLTVTIPKAKMDQIKAPMKNGVLTVRIPKVEMNTRLDWRVTTRAHVLEVSPPRFTDEDVLVELKDGRVLKVSVASGKFVSRFKVPDDARLEGLKTSTHNGVLTVTIPKAKMDQIKAPMKNGVLTVRIPKVEMNTRLDWRVTTRAHVLEVSPPGFTDEDVLVELKDGRVLKVSVASGKFVSRFKVPDDARLERLKASMHNGVLTVTIPKAKMDQIKAAMNNGVLTVTIPKAKMDQIKAAMNNGVLTVTVPKAKAGKPKTIKISG
jgi:HSP20 family molecular chaperone IbpA